MTESIEAADKSSDEVVLQDTSASENESELLGAPLEVDGKSVESAVLTSDQLDPASTQTHDVVDSQPVLETVEEKPPFGEGSDTDDEATDEALVAELAAERERRVAELRTQEAQLAAELMQISDTLRKCNEWVASRQETYAFLLSQSLDEERSTVEADALRAKTLVDEVAVPQASEIYVIGREFTWALRTLFLSVMALGLGAWLLRSTAQKVLSLLPIPQSLLQLLLNRVLDYLTGNFLRDAVVVVLLYFVGRFAVAFVSYYRSWSNLAMRIKDAMHALKYGIRLSEHVAMERARLKSLHTFAMSWLQTLSMALRNPWRMPAGLPVDPSVEMNEAMLPLSTRFGLARVGTRAQELMMRRATLKRVVRRSWRENAFKELVGAVADSLGMSRLEFALAKIDHDLGEASSQTFATLSKNLQDESILMELGTQRYDDLFIRIRDEVIPQVEPPITSMHDDPLTGFEWTVSGAAKSTWTEFRKEIFSSGAVEDTPTAGVFVLSDAGRARQAISRTNTRAIALIPEGLDIGETGLLEDRYSRTARGGVDFTARIEITGPLDPSLIRYFDMGGFGHAPSSDDVPLEEPGGTSQDFL